MSTILKTENLSRSYTVAGSDVPVLSDVNLSIEEGEFVAIMGPSGSGKSSLLYLLGGLDIPTSGSVYFKDQNINKMDDKTKSNIRRRDIGFVFQFYNLIQNLSVVENILLPIAMDGKKTTAYEDELHRILDIVGLSHRKNYTPRELSGGQQQRVAIARALIANPALILADEPIGNLDSATGTEIMELFQTINRENGISIIQVTHSEDAAAYSKRFIHMKDGTISAEEKDAP